jgi:hypothetical protein
VGLNEHEDLRGWKGVGIATEAILIVQVGLD